MIRVFISIIPSVLYGTQLYYFTLRKPSFSLCICRKLFVPICKQLMFFKTIQSSFFKATYLCLCNSTCVYTIIIHLFMRHVDFNGDLFSFLQSRLYSTMSKCKFLVVQKKPPNSQGTDSYR